LYETLDGVAIYRYPHRESSGGAFGYVLEYAWALWHMRRLARRLDAEVGGFDAVQLCNPPDALFLAVRSLRRRGTRVVFDHHDLFPELYALRFGRRRPRPLYRLAALFERFTFGLADVVLSPNESYRRVAIGRGGKKPEDTFVVRIAPDLEQFRPRQPDPELRRGKEHLIAYVGTMGYQDGLDHALRALELLSRNRQDWHAVLAGTGDAASEVHALAQQLGLDGLAEFVGHIGDAEILRLLSTADVCLAPEPKNPLNDASTMIKVVEYMALARPVVAFDLTETRFSADGAALYATPNDDAELASCIERLLDDPALRVTLGSRGRARIEEKLSWRRSEEQLLAAYERAVGPR
jgi:glycosyltransferase involved in cell wall biosynthesis